MCSNSLNELGSFSQLNFSGHFHSKFHKITLYCHSVNTYSVGFKIPTITVSEQPHMTLSQFVFINAKPVESCSENVCPIDWVLYLRRENYWRLNLTKWIDIDHGNQGVHMSMMSMPTYKHKCTIKTGLVQLCRPTLRQSANTTHKHTQHH